MVMPIMWVVIAICLIRSVYVSIKDKNWSFAIGSFLLFLWACYKVGEEFNILPASMCVF